MLQLLLASLVVADDNLRTTMRLVVYLDPPRMHQQTLVSGAIQRRG